MQIERLAGNTQSCGSERLGRRRTFAGARSVIGVSMLAAVGIGTSPSAIAEDNDDLELGIAALIGTHNFALPFSFSPDPLVGIPAGIVTFATNLGLKDTRAVFVTPGDWSDWPTSTDGCTFDFELPQSAAEYSNLLGFIDLKTAPGEWGELTRTGSMQVVHANTGVNVHVVSPYVDAEEPGQQTVSLPPGNHGFEWRADTQISTAFDIIIPAALLTYNSIKYGAAVANQGASAARQAAMQNAARSTLQNIAISTGLVTVSQFFDTRTSVTHSRDQEVTIYKPLGPEISTTDPVLVLEATDFGGVSYARVADQLAQTIEASDPCDLPFFLGNNAPDLLGIGSNDLTWTVRDFGPLPGGGVNSDAIVQQVIVEDTQAPIMVPPPSRVIEVAAGEPGLDASAVELGVPRVVDLADPAPAVANDGPSFHPIDSRSPITWTATDQSGNASQGDQLITVKTLGTNTAPVVDDAAASTLTSMPVDIVLTGLDNDFLDGRFDPLTFSITRRPANGEFVAPLYPFFIEDYRTSPGGPYGDPFVQASNPRQWLYQNVCQVLSGPDNDKIPLDWVHRPLFVHVTDDGIYVMIDFYFRCGPSSASQNKRLSFWDADGEYIDQVDYSGSNNTFVVDRDSFLYTLRRNGGGTSTSLLISQSQSSIDPDTPQIGGDSWRITSSSASNPDLGLADFVNAESLSYGRVDTGEGLLYVTDRRRVFVFDVLADLADGVPDDNNNMNPLYRGALNNGDRFLCTSGSWGNDWTGFAMDVDPDGNLYVADSCSDRVHKFAATTRDAAGQVVRGDYIGWMGRCETSTNNACDEEKQISKGYSCTDATCSVGAGGFAGSEDGQFSELEFIALDPNGVLYATDEGDPATGGRVQRFGTDGSFGGVARSTGTGINQGDRPGFVLGNLGTVRAVSVNSTQFFVVDQEESFVHVFETSPLKDITDESVTVTYVSDFDFHSDVDSFQFVATDGLADSNVGTATINVARNFRAPQAPDRAVVTDENQPIDIMLEADDPDGIVGIDFNGLDILDYQIVEPPAHGQLSPASADNATATFTYTPNPDSFGEDRFVYIASDGVDDSAPAEVAIRVMPIDDPPQVTELSLPPRVGLGLPVTINAEFEDDGAIDYSAMLLAGDGSPVQSRGGILEDDNRPRLDGIVLVEPALGRGKGQAVAQHVFTSAGSYAMDFCVADQLGRQDCRQITVVPEALVGLGLSLPDDHGSEPPAPITAGDGFFVDVVVGNLEPDGAAGLIALAIAMEGTVSGGDVTFAGASEGICQVSPDGFSMSCDFGDFGVGEERTIRLWFDSDFASLDDADVTIDLSFTTESPAVNDLMNVSAVRTVDAVGGIFRDNFESQ
ncbi:MAG TPA: Ig-like domain-containing protein [Wenzhouxiangellaceae bacterium]|nr:Ig-like domain-containing protein [Wenzhouxiangellaceae bacterium]